MGNNKRGTHYTPQIWANKIHNMLDTRLGLDWSDNDIVWDNCCGRGGLTSGRTFAQLYLSTLFEEDLDQITDQDCVKFQYDFLYDDWSKMERSAPGLHKALHTPDQKILIIMNPPFASGSNPYRASNGRLANQKRAGVSNTPVKEWMTSEEGVKLGRASNQLYLQFLYRVIKMNQEFEADITIACVSGNFLSLPSYDSMRRYIWDSYHYDYGFLFPAIEFEGLSSQWGILVSLWQPGGRDLKTEYFVELCERNEASGRIEIVGHRTLYNNDLEEFTTGSDFIKEPLSKDTTKDTVYLSSALKPHAKMGYNRIYSNGFLGGFLSDGNIVERNSHLVALGSGMFRSASSINCCQSNFKRVVSYFTARRLISGPYATWINGKDEYMIPDTSHPKHNRWDADSIIYSLFNTASNQSSLRDIEYNDKTWNIYNHFAWYSYFDIKELAEKYDNKEVLEDIKNHGKERFVYGKILENEYLFSDDAMEILNKANELIVKSFPYREEFDKKNSHYHINAWDLGWYQLVGLVKEYFPEDLKEFRNLYNAFADRMRPLVFELGFLRPEDQKWAYFYIDKEGGI